MEKYLGVLKKSKLFAGLSADELLSSLGCLRAATKDYSKNDIIFDDGECVESLGIILSGEVQTQKIDYDGNANIISRLFPADVIAVSVCYSKDKRLPFEVVAASDCRIMFLTSTGLIRPCNSACAFHARLIQNMLSIIADRNLLLAAKIDILTRRTIKEKVLAYLHNQSRRARFSALSDEKPLAGALTSPSASARYTEQSAHCQKFCAGTNDLDNTTKPPGADGKTDASCKTACKSACKTACKTACKVTGKKDGWFSVPLSRRQMADYLSINRSALSRQLCILRDEGILEFEGNNFRIK